uniref:Interleukin 17 receptor C n=1 Tax=Leptobrachium leishanense TaxID=445787 RepID=A0A8C5QXT8_9ANUR
MCLLAMRHCLAARTPRMICVFLLTLLLNNAICTLERIYSYSDQVTCTGDLSCTLSNVLCIPGDKEEVVHPVLVPDNMRSQTILRCKGDQCFPCVEVVVDIYAAYLTVSEYVADDCDEYYYDCSDESGSFYCEYQNVNDLDDENGNLICAYVFINAASYSSQHCATVKVSVPLLSISLGHKQDRIKLGSLTFRCFNSSPDSEVNLTLYTVPRYQDIINNTHHVSGCKTLLFQKEVTQCAVPTQHISFEENLSVGIVNGSRHRSYNLFYFDTSKKSPVIKLNGDERYTIPKEFMVTCLCLQVWWSNQSDTVREMRCPLKDRTDLQLEENLWSHSNFSVTVERGLMLYNFQAPCNVSAEVSLCWKYSHSPRCQELPFSYEITTYKESQLVSGVVPHPSLCMQVKSKGKIRHMECAPVQASQNKVELKEEVVLLASSIPQRNASSVCLMEKHICTQLYNSTHQIVSRGYMEQNIISSYLSDRCLKIWSDGENNEVYVCSLERRHRWIMLYVVAVLFLLFLVIVTHKLVTKWFKSVFSYKPLGEIFQNRRVWIVYAPDSQTYIDLVRVFAASLKNLQLNVVLDQWHINEICKLGTISWSHRQRSLIKEDDGIIILLFDEGALERYKEWIGSETQCRLLNSDPYCSFGSALSCIHADFVKGSAEECYVVASFGQVNVPLINNSYTLFRLPSKMEELLQKLAGSNQDKLRKTQLDQLSKNIAESLKEPMKKYQHMTDLQRRSSQPGHEMVSMNSNGDNMMEQHLLI